MNTSIYEINLQNDGAQNYLVIGLPMSEEIIPYCIHTLEKNQIPGLLPLSYQFLNGETRLRYKTSGKINLGSLLHSSKVDLKAGKFLLRNLTNSIKGLEAYFIGVDKLLLDPEYLYVGDGYQVFIPCIPTTRSVCDMETDLKKFYMDVISKYLGVGNYDYNDMFMWIYNQERFDLQTYENKFLKDTATSPAPSMEHKPANQNFTSQVTNRTPQAPINKPVESGSPVPPKSYNIPAQKPQGFSIPSQGNQNIPDQDEGKKNPIGGFLKKDKDKPQGNPGLNIPAFGKSQNPVGIMKTADGKALNIPGMDNLAAPKPVEKDDNQKKSGFGFWGKNNKQAAVNTPEVPVSQGVKSSAHPYIVYRGQQTYINSFPFTIGQGSVEHRVDYIISGNPRVSHRHATISFASDNYYLADDNSKNGTFLNGNRVQPGTQMILKDGDEIRLYDEILKFYLI